MMTDATGLIGDGLSVGQASYGTGPIEMCLGPARSGCERGELLSVRVYWRSPWNGRNFAVHKIRNAPRERRQHNGG